MKNDLTDTKGLLQQLSDQLHVLVRENTGDGWILILQIASKLLLLFALVFVIDFVMKMLFRGVYLLFGKRLHSPLVQAMQSVKLFATLSHIFAVAIGREMIYSVFYRHPQSYVFLERTFSLLMVVAFAYFYFRLLKALVKYYELKQDFYRITAIRAIAQSLNIVGIFIFGFLGLSNLFGISSSTILGSLTAMTAVILLVFRDTILGFVTGIHVSTSRNLKVGDWIGIPKYSIEGTILDINLLTTKIQNFDKTISTVPTYDLLQTEIKNLQVMSESNTRRVKRSIYFNIRSFDFVDAELFEELAKINLISGYLSDMRDKIEAEKKLIPNSEEIINGRQLTNIGVFRIYAIEYLKKNPRVDQSGPVMVRQLEITPQGLPLEIYCFANDSKWESFEQIQADIFDHLMVAAKEFKLEVVQFTKI